MRMILLHTTDMRTLEIPLKYVDPSGHDPQCTLVLDGQCVRMSDRRTIDLRVNPSRNWREDEGYKYESDSIPDWGKNWEKTYMQRAAKVYRWMCNNTGWWGDGCPSPYDLTAWLLDHEVGVMLRDENYYGTAVDAARLIVTYTLYLFSDGIDPNSDLGKYTSFYNPGTDSSSFNSRDWKLITTPPTGAAYSTVDYFIDNSYPYPGQDLVWWDPADDHAPPYTTYLFYVKQVKLHLALKEIIYMTKKKLFYLVAIFIWFITLAACSEGDKPAVITPSIEMAASPTTPKSTPTPEPSMTPALIPLPTQTIIIPTPTMEQEQPQFVAPLVKQVCEGQESYPPGYRPPGRNIPCGDL